MRLKAVKMLTYNTRRLLPGDVFDARPRDARLLLAIRKAEAMREPAALAPPPRAVAQKIAAVVVPPTPLNDPNPPALPPNDPNPPKPPDPAPPPPPLPGTIAPSDLAAARAEYERVSGKKAFNGWDIATLQAKTAAAKTV